MRFVLQCFIDNMVAEVDAGKSHLKLAYSESEKSITLELNFIH